MTSLITTFDKAVNSFFNGDWDMPTTTPAYSSPSVDIVEEGDKYVITADLPGVDKKDISISAEDGILSINAERNVERKENVKGYKYFERHTGTFKRSFRLTDSLDADKIAAEYKNGVLTLSVPKKEKATARRIEIK